MFESLKRLAIQKLMAKMASNALGTDATAAAAEQGAGAVMESIKAKLAGGNLDQIKDLFQGGNMESNPIFQEAKEKMTGVLKAQGMSDEDAAAEATNATPDLINGLKEKFESKDEADKEFNLEDIAKMLPGNVGDMLGNAGGILNTAKKLFG